MSNHLQRLEIENYRGFDQLTLDDLADVNVIVGRNNVGKTALFEALVLLGWPCHVDNSVTLNEIRGLPKLAATTEETWSLHFNQRHAGLPVRILGSGAEGSRRELTLRMGQGAELIKDRNGAGGSPLEPNLSALRQQSVVRFEFEHSNGESAWAIAAVVGGKLAVIDSSVLPSPVMSCHASTWRLLVEAPQLYSDVVRAGQERMFLEGIRSIDADISRFDLLTRAGIPTLHASLGDGPLLPVQVMGDGVARVASWLLAITRLSDAWYLIDEVEAGIHHSALVNVWRVLIETAKRRNVQVFATTHSYEALEALNEAHRSLSKRNRPSMRVIRLQKTRDEIGVIPYDEGVLAAAVSGEVEVR